MNHNSRGSITRAFNRQKRWQEDEEYKEKRKESQRRYQEKNKEELNEKMRDRIRVLNEFANKRCKTCNVLLYYKNESGFCKSHCYMPGRPKRT